MGTTWSEHLENLWGKTFWDAIGCGYSEDEASRLADRRIQQAKVHRAKYGDHPAVDFRRIDH